MWKNIVEPVRPQITIWLMLIAYWIRKATNTHFDYVILMAYPHQQCLHDRSSALRYTYVHCMSCSVLTVMAPKSKTVFALSCF